MAKTSTTTITVEIGGDGVDQTYEPAGSPITNTSAPSGGPMPYVLSSGDNTISVPSGSVGFVIVPSTASTVVKKLKGGAGDTGFTIRASAPSVVSMPNSTSSILINASAGETVSIQWL
jgi:hypothetical protein